jgi:hypothetical protein
VGSLTTLKALDTFSIGTTNGEKVPKSCCKQPKGTELKEEDVTKCQKDPAHADYDLKGCFTKLKDSVRDHKSKILGVAITILVVMVSSAQIMAQLIRVKTSDEMILMSQNLIDIF